MNKPFLTDIKTLRARARQHMEQGAVHWRGLPVSHDWRAFLRGLTYLGHDAPLKADLTGRENLAFWVGLRRAVLPAELREGLARTGASRFSDRPVANSRRMIRYPAVSMPSPSPIE